MWSVIAAFIVTIIVLVFATFWSQRSVSLWSYVPAQTQQLVYVELNDTMREVLIRDDSAIPADIRALFDSVDTLLLGQNADTQNDFSFVLGILREDIDTNLTKDALESFLTTGYDYAMLTREMFVYGTEENIAKVREPNDEETFVNEALVPYIKKMEKENHNIAVFTKVTDASFVQAPALTQGVDAMVLLASWYSDDMHGSFHVVGDSV